MMKIEIPPRGGLSPEGYLSTGRGDDQGLEEGSPLRPFRGHGGSGSAPREYISRLDLPLPSTHRGVHKKGGGVSSLISLKTLGYN
jgi:hypothetical protein